MKESRSLMARCTDERRLYSNCVTAHRVLSNDLFYVPYCAYGSRVTSPRRELSTGCSFRNYSDCLRQHGGYLINVQSCTRCLLPERVVTVMQYSRPIAVSSMRAVKRVALPREIIKTREKFFPTSEHRELFFVKTVVLLSLRTIGYICRTVTHAGQLRNRESLSINYCGSRDAFLFINRNYEISLPRLARTGEHVAVLWNIRCVKVRRWLFGYDHGLWSSSRQRAW